LPITAYSAGLSKSNSDDMKLSHDWRGGIIPKRIAPCCARLEAGDGP